MHTVIFFKYRYHCILFMETLQKLIENNPGLFRILGPLLGLAIGYLFYLLVLA